MNENIEIKKNKNEIIIINNYEKEYIKIPHSTISKIINSLRNRKPNDYSELGFCDKFNIDDETFIDLRVFVNDRSLSEVKLSKYYNNHKIEGLSLYYIPGSERQDLDIFLIRIQHLVPKESSNNIQTSWGFRKKKIKNKN